MSKKYDVAVIGGGIAGLTAALILAKSRKKVIVLESQDRMGGRAITNNKKGINFNLGSHAFYYGPAYTIFQELGIDQTIFQNVSEFDSHKLIHGIWNEKVYPLPSGIGALLKTSLLSLRDKVKFATVLTKIIKLDADLLPPISLRAWMEENIDSPMVRHLLYVFFRGGTYVLAPDLQLVGPSIKQLQEGLNGVFYIKRGWDTLIQKLCAEAERLGVTLRTSTKVKSIEHANGVLQEIQCGNDEKIPVSHAIITTSPKIASQLVPLAEKTSLKTWEKQAIPIKAACLDIGLRRLPNPKYQFVYGVDQPILMVNASRVKGLELSEDASVQVFQLIKFLGQESNPEDDRKDLEKAMDLVQPHWQKEVITKQFLPKMTVVHDFPHLKRTENPGPAVPEIKGLYIAGDWATHGESLVDGAAASAKRAASHILASTSS